MLLFIAVVVSLVLDSVFNGLGNTFHKIYKNKIIFAAVAWVLFWGILALVLMPFDVKIPMPALLYSIINILGYIFGLIALFYFLHDIVKGRRGA